MRVITLATSASLPRARVLAQSLRRHEPRWTHEIVWLSPTGSERLTAGTGNGLPLRPITDLLDLNVERLIARHDEEHLALLLVPHLLAAYARERDGPVVHVPAHVWVLDNLQPLEQAMAARSVLLVPRVVADLPEDGLEPSPAQLQRAGRIEGTIIGVDGTAAVDGFLAWWSARVEQTLGSLDGRRSGARPEDRPWLARFLELAPARFSAAVPLDLGCNLSMWNLHERALVQVAEGLCVDSDRPARFLNLLGFEPHRPERLNPIASRVRVSQSEVLRDLCVNYAQQLRDAGWELGPSGRIGQRLPGGLVYEDRLDFLHQRALASGQDFGDVFSESGASAFVAWLQGPAPEGGAYGINRYLYYRIARERPDVFRAYPDLDGPDGADCVAWCWAFGRGELGIPERFMPAHDVEPPPVPPTETQAQSQAGEPAGGASGHEAGAAVRVTGYLGHSLGLGAAARGYAQALRAAGVPVSTVSVPLHHLGLPVQLSSDYGRHSFEDQVHNGRHGFELIAVNADELPEFVERLGADYFEGPRIGIWGWETNVIPPRWQRAFALVDEIWVYSKFMAQNIGAVAPVPVTALAPPVQPPPEPAAPLRLGVPAGFLFLFIFDYLSTIQRKNPVGLIEAFKLAFAPGEGPQLILKTINAPLRPLADEQVLWAAHGRPDIHVIDRSLDSHELAALMAACDCYVSLHRSEGFGLTMAEAMAIGKPVIATGYSGNVDFMNEQNSYLVDYEIGRVGPECEIYPPEGEWAEPSVNHAATLMRDVYLDRDRSAQLAARAREDVARLLAPAVTGAAMRRRLEQRMTVGPA